MQQFCIGWGNITIIRLAMRKMKVHWLGSTALWLVGRTRDRWLHLLYECDLRNSTARRECFYLSRDGDVRPSRRTLWTTTLANQSAAPALDSALGIGKQLWTYLLIIICEFGQKITKRSNDLSRHKSTYWWGVDRQGLRIKDYLLSRDTAVSCTNPTFVWRGLNIRFGSNTGFTKQCNNNCDKQHILFIKHTLLMRLPFTQMSGWCYELDWARCMNS